MTSPYSTPRYPGAPNPTPRSTQKALRPPIHNPYDKFTQPEFDAWISNITGALKRALGREEAPTPSERAQPYVAEEEVVEDSFAEVKARRLAKGKERARDEDLEPEGEAPRVDGDNDGEDAWGEPYSGEEYSVEESGESGEEDSDSKEAEVIDLLSDDDEAGPEVQRGEDASEEDESQEERAAEHDEGSEVGSDDDGESSRSSPAAGPSHVARSYAHEVTEILDSEEEQEEEEEEEERRALPARFLRKPDIIAPARLESAEDEGVAEDADEQQVEEEEDPFPPRTERKEPVDIDDPWRGPTTYAEDFYSGGDIPTSALERGNPHTMPAEEPEDDELVADEPARTPDLPDPWEGPRKFAEDYYAGGDVLPDPADGATPSHLTPKDEGKLFIPGISSASEDAQAVTEKATSPGILDVDDLYADVGEQAPEQSKETAEAGEAGNAEGDDVSAEERSPSPPSATLRTHVDWNWPPAFPGRVATGPGHIGSPEQEIFEISDDEDDEDDEPPSAERPVQPVVNDARADESADEGEQRSPMGPVDTSGLYADFDDLYEMGPPVASIDMQSSFEPISPPGLDFGDLPTAVGAFSGGESNDDVQPLDVNEAPPSLQFPSAQEGAANTMEAAARIAELIADVATASAEASEPIPAPRRFSVGLEEVTDEEDPDAKRVPAPERVEPEVEVFEVDDEDDIRSSAPLGDDIDISSVRSDVEISPMDYLVEEVKTEGRRTEEPEQAAEEEGSKEPIVSSDPAEINDEDVLVEADQDLRTDPVDGSAGGAAIIHPEPADDAPESTLGKLDVPTTPQNTSAEAGVPTSLQRTLSSSAFPPPVSANPNVPDPASLPGTPQPPASPETRSPNVEAAALPANPALQPLFRKLASTTHSPSGLFTPLPNEDSASVTPEREASTAPVADEAPRTANTDIAAEAAAEPVVEVDAAEPVDNVEPQAEVVEPTEERPAEAEYATPPTKEASPDLPAEKAASQDELNAAPQDDAAETQEPAVDARPASPASDFDVDAEGEIDPEYVLHEGKPYDISDVLLEEGLSPITAAEEETAASGDAAEPEQAEEPDEKSVVPPAEEIPDSTPTAEGLAASGPEERKTALDADEATRSSPVDESASAETQDEARPRKRKRRSPPSPSTSTRVTRSKSSLPQGSAYMELVAQAYIRKKGKGKARQRKQIETDEEDGASVAHSHTSESTSGGSSAAAQKMLVPDSRGTSRASSVVSNAPSTYSGISQFSPTIDRVLPSNGNGGPPPPFLHNHGILHHHHGRPVVPVVPVAPKRQPSEPPVPTAEVARQESAEAGPSTQPLPSRPAVFSSTSSPVTRSNCRFHAISVPKEENGPRVLFAVPGCALGGNAELMKDEEIEDQGYVKPGDVPRLITDVESLNLSPYLIGILRQLVGVDLLREQEVFYIPRAGDGVVLRSKHKSRRAKLKQMESISARTLSNGGASRRKGGTPMAPPSQASVSTSGESASHAGKLSQRGSATGSGSFSGSELSDLEDEEAPPAKRVKEDHPDASARPEPSEPAEQPSEAVPVSAPPPGDGPAVADENAATSTADAKTRKLQPRRSRRLGIDNAAYKPDGGESDGSGDEAEADTKKRRKRGGKRGVKRTRTEENGDAPAGEGAEQPKRRRVRNTASNAHKPAAANAEAEGVTS